MSIGEIKTTKLTGIQVKLPKEEKIKHTFRNFRS